MSSVLMTSTMKSPPTLPLFVNFGRPDGGCVSPAVCGRAGTAGLAASTAPALFTVAAKPSAGPAATAPAKNWRRLIFGVFDTVAVPMVRVALIGRGKPQHSRL